MKSRATLALSNHRPESIPPAKRLMATHDVVILEEPPDELFQKMLSGEIDIDAYLRTQDLEYPDFSRRLTKTLREVYKGGKRLYQVEPFLERLLEIHEFFAAGGTPAGLKSNTVLSSVYNAEREATAALLDFYSVSIRGTFEETVKAVKSFARADARRFLLRDRMRADAVAQVLIHEGACYIEAGQIHYTLWRELKRRLPSRYPLKLRFLMADAVREMGYRTHLYGPGDVLTLLYMFHPDRDNREDDELAGRALIHNKIITKEEIAGTPDTGPYPHTLDELKTAQIVGKLSLEDCRRLFPLIRRASTVASRERVRD